MTTPKLIPPRDVPVIDLRTGRLTDVWYDFFQIGIPSSKVFGTTTNDSAPAGGVGEVLSSGPTTVSLTTATAADVTSKLLTPGDWDVWAPVQFAGGVTTTVTEALSSLSTTSATPVNTVGQHCHWRGDSTTDLFTHQLIGPFRVSLSVATIYYLVAQAWFLVSSYSATGAIHARRVR